MNINAFRELGTKMMTENGLTDWTLTWGPLSRRALGQCNYDSRTIAIRKDIVKVNIGSILKNILLHEIAHALVGSQEEHGGIWEQKAISIGWSKELEGLEWLPWVASCGVCGREYQRLTSPRGVLSCKCLDGMLLFIPQLVLDVPEPAGSAA